MDRPRRAQRSVQEHSAARGPVVAVVPTFNERGNVEELVQRIRALPMPVEVLVVDDDSPDGTWSHVEAMQAEDPRLHLLHRRTDRGRGRAGRAGFVEALRMGAETIVEMDADLSHDPAHIPTLVQALDRYDVVLGSRAVAGGTDDDRSLPRRALTLAANLYTRWLLRVDVRDCNSGFRAYRRQAMEALDPASFASRGPAIVQEVLHRARSRGLTIGEVPITFVDRRVGISTLTFGKLINGYLTVLRLRLRELLGRG